eukprot:gi/632979303/ref/XP_007906395.1/ PREDICTED: general transcription factor 3C polypeptide 1 [Callorhinchus milii]
MKVFGERRNSGEKSNLHLILIFCMVLTRYEEIDPETGIQESYRDPTPRYDVYPINIIFDQDEIQGSCLYFNERVCITAEIRNSDFQPTCTLDEAVARWGEKLVIVASQMMRHRALIGWENDIELKLPDYSYCILERLGRARWQGELQRDLHSGAFKIDARKMHYHRRVLDRNDLITLQAHVIRQANGNQQYSILLLLKRFHVDRRSKYDILMEKISNILTGRPNQIDILQNLRDELGLCERTFKKLYQYLVAAGLAKIVSIPLQELHPDSGPRVTKKGTQIIVRCLKLLKAYRKKVEEEDDDDEDSASKAVESVDVVYERDMLTQAYELVEKSGTRGISQSAIRMALNVGKLEGRMLCRLLERYKVVTGFMEDEGRQRTTKYVARPFVAQSELSKQFEKEKARHEWLATASLTSPEPTEEEHCPPSGGEEPGEDVTDYVHEDLPEETPAEAAADQSDPVPSPALPLEENRPVPSHLEPKEKSCIASQTIINQGKKLVKSALLRKLKLKKGLRRTKLGKVVTGRKRCSLRKLAVGNGQPQSLEKGDEEPAGEAEAEPSQQDSGVALSAHSEEEEIAVIEEVKIEKPTERECGSKIKKLCRPRLKRPHETCRLLKRKNMIIEAVRSLKLIESLFSLQKMIMDQEKLDGIGTRCCKKSIIRMVQTLSQEGFLRLYRTTVIQDGIKKKVELVVHPSIFPTDPLVKSAIEQVRFRISSSYTAHRMKASQNQAQREKQESEKAAAEMEANKGSETPSKPSTKRTEEKMGVTPLKNYHPVIVPGLGRSLGFLPKMPRLRLVHTFLWYVVYGHPLRKPPAEALNSEATEALATDTAEEALSSAMSNKVTDVPKTILSESNLGTGAETLAPNADSEGTQWNCEIEPLFVNKTVYADEATWKRYTPATPIHKEFGQGWALVSDVLLCLPLSIFIQIVQVSHKVDNMEEYINDQMKKFSLVKHLPQPMRQQLLYKRRYIFSFFESLQRLCYMGLLQFGPTEKFQEKDQVFISIKRNATIVDTTSCDPHYNMARSNRPFDKRRYTFNRFQDVESFWFDLMCVCLNTPLGVIRFPRQNKKSGQATQAGAEERVPNSVMDQETAAGRHTLERRCAMLEYTTGSRSLVDDGIIPGDGLGAAGLDSSFFGHLKRNWIWTSYIISNAKKNNTPAENSPALRLQIFLSKHPLSLSIAGNALNMLGAAEEPLARRAEDIRMEKEPNMGRNKRVGGGKGMKRKSPEKDSVRRPRKRKRRRKDESSEQQKAKRFRFHDDADKSALCRMTKLRVTWTAQEDSLLMLCRVASHVLNKKVKGPFVPWQAVRDVLHAHFEEALDKTSLAVGRRSRYILRNPQTMLNYRICLAEVYQDHDLIEEFMNKSGDYQDFHVCSAEFKVFVGRLREKFSSTIGSGNIDIPDTLQELFARYKILVIGEEEDEEQKQDEFLSIDDIHYVVLQNLIQSTLTLSDTQMKSCQSFQTFHLYKQYNDDVLVKVFVEFQEKSLINRRRVSKSLGPKKSRALPFAPMSYQLSQTYFRNFVWRFPNYICSETYHFVEKLKSAGTADIPNTFSFPGKETLMETNMVTYPLDGNGGYCVATISLFVLGLLSFSVSIPEQIVVVDSTLVDNEVIKRLGKEGLDDYDDEDLDETGSKPRIEVKAPQASHTNYLLMRGYYAPGIVNTRNLNPNDNIVVNSCQVRLKLRGTPALGGLGTHDLAVLYKSASGEHEVPQSFTKVVRPSTETYGVEKVKKHLMEELGYSPEDLVAVQEISNRIKDSAVFGIGQTELAKAFAHYEETQDERMKTLKQYLQDLMALDQIVAVGGYTNRFVATIHAHPWLLHPLEVKRLNEDLALPSSVELVSEQSIFSRPRANGSESSTENNVLESTEQFEGSRESVKADPNTEIALDERDGLQANTAEAENVPLSCSPVSIENAKRNSEDIGCELDNCGHPSKRSRLTDEASESRHGDRNPDDTVEILKADLVQDTPSSTCSLSRMDQPLTECQDLLPSDPEREGCELAHSESQSGDERAVEIIPLDSIKEQSVSSELSKEECSSQPGNATKVGPETESAQIAKSSQIPLACEDEQISFVCHPWRIVDGSLNKPVLKGMIEAVLYHIMTKPGITEQKLLSYYHSVLQPVAVLELLQGLEDLRCIRRRCLAKSKPASLFSAPTSATEVEDPKLSDSCTVFYEPTIDCVLRLSKLFPHEPNWNKWIQ